MAQRRLDQFRRRTRLSGRGIRSYGNLDYSYNRENYHPLGLRLFQTRLIPSETNLRSIIDEAPRPRVNMAPTPPSASQRQPAVWSAASPEDQSGDALPAFWKLHAFLCKYGQFERAQQLVVPLQWSGSLLLQARFHAAQGNLDFLRGAFVQARPVLRAAARDLEAQSPWNLHEVPRAWIALAYLELNMDGPDAALPLARKCRNLVERERERAEQERERTAEQRKRADEERGRAERERERAEQERERANRERERAERMAAILRDMGVDPDK